MRGRRATGASFRHGARTTQGPGRALRHDAASRRQRAGAGTAPPVTCPGDLPTQKDASIRCRATISGETYGVTVTITGGSGQNAVYALTVDQKPS